MGTSLTSGARVAIFLSLKTLLLLHLVSGRCRFDNELHGEWDYTDKMIKTVHINSHYISFYDKHFNKRPLMNMQCYEKDGDVYLLRAPRLFSLNVDATLCVRIFRKLKNPIIYEVDVPRGRNTFLEQIKLSKTEPNIRTDCRHILMGFTEANHLYREERGV